MGRVLGVEPSASGLIAPCGHLRDALYNKVVVQYALSFKLYLQRAVPRQQSAALKTPIANEFDLRGMLQIVRAPAMNI